MKSEGPFLVIPSRRGAVPDLTLTQVMNILQPEERLISVSFVDASMFEAPCSQSHCKLATFCGLPDFRVILTPKSAFCGLHASGPTTSQSVSCEHENGRLTIDVAKWIRLVEVLQPQFAVPLHDAIPLSEESYKKRKIAYTRSEMWYKQIVDQMKSQSCTLLTPSSLHLPVKTKFVDFMPQNENVKEFHSALMETTHGEAAMQTNTSDCNVMEKDKQIVMCIANSIAAIGAAIDANVNLIESTLPWALAEKGIALTIDLATNHNNITSTQNSLHEPQIDLNDPCYTLDVKPLCKDCTCFTCTRHHRAYLHHLLTVQEMNASILLVIHNLAWLVQWLRRCRKCQTHSERTKLLWHVLSQC